MKFAITYTKNNADGSIEYETGYERYSLRTAIGVLEHNGFKPFMRMADRKLPRVFKGNNRMAYIVREDEI